MKSVPFLFALVLSTPVFADSTAPVNPHAGMPMRNMPAHQSMLNQSGTVLSTLNVPSYTYVEVSQGGKKKWLAAATTAAKKGDKVKFDDGMVMTNFYSKTLKRAFPSIVFVNSLVVVNGK